MNTDVRIALAGVGAFIRTKAIVTGNVITFAEAWDAESFVAEMALANPEDCEVWLTTDKGNDRRYQIVRTVSEDQLAFTIRELDELEHP